MTPAAAQLPSARRRFAYFLDDVTRPPRAALAAHARYLAMLEARGTLLLGGAFREGDGVVCIEADDDVEADSIARADPLVAFGFTLYRLREVLTSSW